MNSNVQIITPIINPDNSVTLHLSESQFEEIKFAIQSLNKRRQTSRDNMAPKRIDVNKSPKAVKPILTFSWPERLIPSNNPDSNKYLDLNVSPSVPPIPTPLIAYLRNSDHMSGFRP